MTGSSDLKDFEQLWSNKKLFVIWAYNFAVNCYPIFQNFLMIWKNKVPIFSFNLDSRRPIVRAIVAIKFYCQLYRKSLTIDHWGTNCL